MTVPKKCDVTRSSPQETWAVFLWFGHGWHGDRLANVVFITHQASTAAFVCRAIDAYQRHRIKKLKQQQGRGY